MNRVRFLSKIAIMASFVLALTFTFNACSSSSDDPPDPSSSSVGDADDNSSSSGGGTNPSSSSGGTNPSSSSEGEVSQFGTCEESEDAFDECVESIEELAAAFEDLLDCFDAAEDDEDAQDICVSEFDAIFDEYETEFAECIIASGICGSASYEECSDYFDGTCDEEAPAPAPKKMLGKKKLLKR